MDLLSMGFVTGIVITTPLILLVIGLFFAIMLTIAHNRLKVQVDPRVAAVRDALPGANCGGCGYASCDQFAEAAAKGAVAPGDCVVLSADSLQAIAGILGIAATAGARKGAIIHCGARHSERRGQPLYRGAATCAEMNLIAGIQACTHGCLGAGDCAISCPFDAIAIVEGLPVVDYAACTGCGNCVDACPREIISIEELHDDPLIVIACSSPDPGKYVRGACPVGCIGCGICAKLDPDVFSVENNLCGIEYAGEKYRQTASHLAVVSKCPTVCLRQVGTAIGDPHAQVAERERAKAARAAAKAQAAQPS